MSEYYEHNAGDHEDPLAGPTWIVGLLGAVLFIVIGLGLTALFYNAQTEEEIEKVVLREPEQILRLRERQLGDLTGEPRWVERNELLPGQDQPQLVKSLVIPIDQAMELVVKEGK